jgi:large subunit ribosomal protein L29
MPRRIEKIRESGTHELEAQQKELTEQIFRLRFQLTTGQAEALKRLREARKDLARVKTLLRAQQLAGAVQKKV